MKRRPFDGPDNVCRLRADRDEDGGFTFHVLNTFRRNPEIVIRRFRRKASKSLSVLVQRAPDLTVHRRTVSHHGRALRTLGHAAEYLVNSRAFSIERPGTIADSEAVRILMRLSREVFEEYAAITSQHHTVTDWIMNRAIRIYGAA